MTTHTTPKTDGLAAAPVHQRPLAHLLTSGTLKAVSLLQPWASLAAWALKPEETRSWKTPHRGLLAIHASGGKNREAREACLDPHVEAALKAHGHTYRTLPRGVILAVAILTDCRRIVEEGTHFCVDNPPATEFDPGTLTEAEQAFGIFTPGRFAWNLADVQLLPTPVPASGALGVWKVPADVIAEIRTQLAPVL